MAGVGALTGSHEPKKVTTFHPIRASRQWESGIRTAAIALPWPLIRPLYSICDRAIMGCLFSLFLCLWWPHCRACLVDPTHLHRRCLLCVHFPTYDYVSTYAMNLSDFYVSLFDCSAHCALFFVNMVLSTPSDFISSSRFSPHHSPSCFFRLVRFQTAMSLSWPFQPLRHANVK